MDTKIKIGNMVKIIKENSAFRHCEGEVITQGNGTMWQVLLDWNIGVYFSEKDLKILP